MGARRFRGRSSAFEPIISGDTLHWRHFYELLYEPVIDNEMFEVYHSLPPERRSAQTRRLFNEFSPEEASFSLFSDEFLS